MQIQCPTMILLFRKILPYSHRAKPVREMLFYLGVFLILSAAGFSQSPHPERPGVSTPGVKRPITELHPDATFAVEGQPDWMVVTDDAVWVTSSNVNHVVRLDAATNKTTAVAIVKNPCSGLAAGFGSIWIPSCGKHALA